MAILVYGIFDNNICTVDSDKLFKFTSKNVRRKKESFCNCIVVYNLNLFCRNTFLFYNISGSFTAACYTNFSPLELVTIFYTWRNDASHMADNGKKDTSKDAYNITMY